jgi:hypothetical protein
VGQRSEILSALFGLGSEICTMAAAQIASADNFKDTGRNWTVQWGFPGLKTETCGQILGEITEPGRTFKFAVLRVR